MTKETEETIVFFVTFLSLVAFQLGGGGAGPLPSPWLRLCQENRASATIPADSGSIPGRVKPKTINFVFAVFLFDVQQWKRGCEASTVCDKQEGRWQLDSKNKEVPFAVFLQMQLGQSKCNYNVF